VPGRWSMKRRIGVLAAFAKENGIVLSERDEIG
jgi:hypothetical protein